MRHGDNGTQHDDDDDAASSDSGWDGRTFEELFLPTTDTVIQSDMTVTDEGLTTNDNDDTNSWSEPEGLDRTVELVCIWKYQSGCTSK